MQTFYAVIPSPVGKLHLIATDSKLKYLIFDSHWKDFEKSLVVMPIKKSNGVLQKAEKELKKYFNGELEAFTIPLEFEGTDFQKKTWRALLKIPFGKTLSYGEQAQKIGHPKAVRAVGATNGKNPIAIIIPCHRVIGKSGKLTGYGGGLPIKEKLLALEKSL